MKYVLFGGGGFIGSAIADRLLLDGHSLRIFERPRVAPYRAFTPTEQVEWLTGDFSNSSDLSAAVEGVDAVIHLVSTTLPKGSNDDPSYDVQTNVVATLQLLKIMALKNVRRIVFISSGGTVYGLPEYVPIDERHPTNPIVSYGITKLCIEKYMLLFERLHGIRPVILRVANPYGIRQRIETAQGVLGVFVHHAIKGQCLEIWGDGSVVRDYIYVSDVAEAFQKALQYDGQIKVFNVSSSVAASLLDIIANIERVLGTRVKTKFLPGRPFDVPVNLLSNELAKKELGWHPQVNMEQGIKRLVDWYVSEKARA